MAQRVDRDVEHDITMENAHVWVEHDNKAVEVGEGQTAVAEAERAGITLDVDIWYLVFEEVFAEGWWIRDTDAAESVGNSQTPQQQTLIPWIRRLRLTSKMFDTILTPRTLHDLEICTRRTMKAILGSEGALGILFEAKIIKYTRSLRVEMGLRDQDPVAIAKLVEKCHGLADFSWKYMSKEETIPFDATREQIRIASREISQRAALYIKAFFENPHNSSTHQGVDFTDNQQSGHLSIRSVKSKSGGGVYCPRYHHEFDSHQNSTSTTKALNRILIKGGSYLAFRSTPLICGGMQWPKMNKLKFLEYEWSIPQADVPLLWDFKALQSLSFDKSHMSFLMFARNVPVRLLSELRTFKYYDDGDDFADLQDIAQEFMVALLHLCVHLENLKVVFYSWMEMIPIHVICKTGQKLRKLRLKTDTCLVRWRRPMDSVDLASILKHCPNLVELDIDIRIDELVVSEYLDFLAQARLLVKLTLTEAENIRIGTADSDDRDYDGTHYIMSSLHSKKRGEPFNLICVVLVDDSPVERKRFYYSRINESGTYEQWGEERKAAQPENAKEASEDM